MLMVMIVYNEAMDAEIMEVLEKAKLKSYTKITGAFGRGEKSGAHLGDDIWPGRNNILYVACEENEKKRLLPLIEELRGKFGAEGVKAFVWNLE